MKTISDMRYNAHQISWGLLRSARFFADMLWNVSGPIKINYVLSLFYIIIAPFMVYLYLTGEETAVSVMADLLSVPWWGIIALFCLSGWVTATPQPARIYMLATMPLLLYAVTILVLTASGVLVIRAILPGAYLLLACVTLLLNIRQRFELDLLRMDLARTRRDLKALQTWIDGRDDIFTRPDKHP